MAEQAAKITHISDNDISKSVVEAAFYVHRQLGQGLLESAYEECLAIILADREIPFQRQVVMPLFFEGRKIDIGYRIDFFVNEELILELKSVEELLPIHEAQLLSYLRLSRIRAGLLINFNSRMFKDGIRRLVL
jgi:GxxExxY protein